MSHHTLNLPLAAREGWKLVESDRFGGGAIVLLRDDQSEKFETDQHAWDHVIRKAVEGSEYHKNAIAQVRRTAPGIFEHHVQDVDVLEVAALDDAFTDNMTHPWLVQFTNAVVVGFDSEDEACAYQRHYRQAVGLDPDDGEFYGDPSTNGRCS